MADESKASQTDTSKRHPLFGRMKGTIKIASGVDLTEPTFPDWEAYEEQHYGPDSELGQIWAKAVERQLKK
jgi:hypothetical protein